MDIICDAGRYGVLNGRWRPAKPAKQRILPCARGTRISSAVIEIDRVPIRGQGVATGKYNVLNVSTTLGNLASGAKIQEFPRIRHLSGC